MYQLVGLEGVGLGEACPADLTLVRLLPGVNPEVALELEGVGAGVGAVRALVRPLTRVTPHVPLQLAQFHAGILTVRTLVGLLVSVDVTDVPHQLTWKTTMSYQNHHHLQSCQELLHVTFTM